MVRTDKLLRELPAMQIVPNFRVRTIPVLGTMPSIFGLAAASYILCQLAQAIPPGAHLQAGRGAVPDAAAAPH